MRRWTGPVTMLVLFSFLAVGPITHTPRAEADCGSAGCAAPVPCNTHAGACWTPGTNARWQYQLEAARDKSGNCLYAWTGGTITQENGPAVSAIHTAGARAICYIDAGGAESFRPDYAEYQAFNANCNGCLFGRPMAVSGT